MRQQPRYVYLSYTSLMKTSVIIKLRIKFHQILHMYVSSFFRYFATLTLPR